MAVPRTAHLYFITKANRPAVMNAVGGGGGGALPYWAAWDAPFLQDIIFSENC